MADIARGGPRPHGGGIGPDWALPAGSPLRVALEGTSEAVTVCDSAGALLFANPPATSLFAQFGVTLLPGATLPGFDGPFETREVRVGPEHRRLSARARQAMDEASRSPVILIWWSEASCRAPPPRPSANARRRRAIRTSAAPGSPQTVDVRERFITRLALLLCTPSEAGPALSEAVELIARTFGALCVLDLVGPTPPQFARLARTSDDGLLPTAWALEEAANLSHAADALRSLAGNGHFTRMDALASRRAVPGGVWVFPTAAQVDALVSAGIDEVMGTPVRSGDRPRAVLTVCRRSVDRPWTREDELLLEEAATWVGLSVERHATLEALRAALAARDEFLTEAAHELKAPVHALLLYLQSTVRTVTERRLELPPWLNTRLAACVRQTQQLRSLVLCLLDVARLSGRRQLTLGLVDVRTLIRDLADRHSAALQEARCELRLDLEPVVCHTDRVWLEEVLSNLLENACKYGRGRPLEIRLQRRGDEVHISIRDHGPGVDETERDQVFARYERGSNSGELPGLGLGLYVAREVVHALGGRLELAETSGGGATFVITLPVEGPRGT